MPDRDPNWTDDQEINVVCTWIDVPEGEDLTYNGKEQTGVAAGNGYTLSGTVSATKAGTYQATLDEGYIWADGKTAARSISWKINKANNPLAIKAKTATVKYKKLKKKAQTLTVKSVITFEKNGQGKMTYTLSSAKKKGKNLKKSFKVNANTGSVKIKKKLKKGTYKVTVKVKAVGNANYNASAWKAVTFKIKVK